MSVETFDPNTILIAGDPHIDNSHVAAVAIVPGMLIEPVASSGVRKFQPNSSATNKASVIVALNQPELNHGVDTPYAIGDLVKAAFLMTGDVFWALIPSGQTIANEQLLQSNGDGYFKDATADTADANVAIVRSLDNLGAITVLTRCRVEVL